MAGDLLDVVRVALDDAVHPGDVDFVDAASLQGNADAVDAALYDGVSGRPYGDLVQGVIEGKRAGGSEQWTRPDYRDAPPQREFVPLLDGAYLPDLKQAVLATGGDHVAASCRRNVENRAVVRVLDDIDEGTSGGPLHGLVDFHVLVVFVFLRHGLFNVAELVLVGPGLLHGAEDEDGSRLGSAQHAPRGRDLVGDVRLCVEHESRAHNVLHLGLGAE
mmetsp:Transcript_2915/g.5410  ORF Transcript_2915/g.5410 Transcript_2915/m.5410 type:complete len:218 (-) Transcript_2915:1373-2026(-)